MADIQDNATVPATEPRRPSRIVELDILRGLAILLVLGIHSPGPQGDGGILHPLDAVMHQLGWSGVDLFFVLSGFLVGGLLFHELQARGEVDVNRFLVRRMLRIWPAFYAFVAFAIVRDTIEFGSFSRALTDLWPAIIHIQNYRETSRTQLWSLGVEEQFYLALPLFLYLLLRSRRGAAALRHIPRIWLGVAVGCVALRSILWLTLHMNVRNQAYLCIDALFLGVTLAYLRAYRPEVLERLAARRFLLPVALLLLAPALVAGDFRNTIGFTSVYLGYALLLIRFVYADHRGPVLSRFVSSAPARAMAWVGTYSFSIYLWHRDVGHWAYSLAERAGRRLGLPDEATWVLHTAAWFAASIAISVVLAKLIEVPVMRLRERLFPPALSDTRPAEVRSPSPAVVDMPFAAQPDI